MRALLASPLGLLIGLSLGALGGGGSILAVPALVYGAGQDPRSATATSLLLVGVAALIGMGRHYVGGRVRVGTGLAFGLIGVGGSIVGTMVNRRMDPDVLLLGFSGLVLLAAWRMVTACPTCTRVGEQVAAAQARAASVDGRGGLAVARRTSLDARRTVTVVATGTAVGFLTGLFGVGGGFVIVPALTLLLGMAMPEAIGTSLLVISVNSAVGLTARMATTTIDWGVTIPFVVAAVIGVLLGGQYADRLDPRRSLRAFAGLLVAVALYTGVDAGGALMSFW